jgi:hypothetical protein
MSKLRGGDPHLTNREAENLAVEAKLLSWGVGTVETGTGIATTAAVALSSC